MPSIPTSLEDGALFYAATLPFLLQTTHHKNLAASFPFPCSQVRPLSLSLSPLFTLSLYLSLSLSVSLALSFTISLSPSFTILPSLSHTHTLSQSGARPRTQWPVPTTLLNQRSRASQWGETGKNYRASPTWHISTNLSHALFSWLQKVCCCFLYHAM